jgi:predicted amidophosphoribosyltransferase
LDAPETEPLRPAVVQPPRPQQPASGGAQRVCPKCRRGYAPGTARCATDGTELLDYAEFMRRAQDSDAPPRACPKCGGQLAADAQFCGLCGQRL